MKKIMVGDCKKVAECKKENEILKEQLMLETGSGFCKVMLIFILIIIILVSTVSGFRVRRQLTDSEFNMSKLKYDKYILSLALENTSKVINKSMELAKATKPDFTFTDNKNVYFVKDGLIISVVPILSISGVSEMVNTYGYSEEFLEYSYGKQCKVYSSIVEKDNIAENKWILANYDETSKEELIKIISGSDTAYVNGKAYKLKTPLFIDDFNKTIIADEPIYEFINLSPSNK